MPSVAPAPQLEAAAAAPAAQVDDVFKTTGNVTAYGFLPPIRTAFWTDASRIEATFLGTVIGTNKIEVRVNGRLMPPGGTSMPAYGVWVGNRSRTITDLVITSGSATATSAAQAQFTSADVGLEVVGANAGTGIIWAALNTTADANQATVAGTDRKSVV